MVWHYVPPALILPAFYIVSLPPAFVFLPFTWTPVVYHEMLLADFLSRVRVPPCAKQLV